MPVSHNISHELDIHFVQQQFPAFEENILHAQSLFENAGGSYACKQTIDALVYFYRKNKLQPYHPHKAAMRAGDAMDSSYQRWAQALGVNAQEVNFGPSTSANTYMLAQAFAPLLSHGDEIIVTVADHEANSGSIRRMAHALDLIVREWDINPTTQQLETEGLANLLNEKTKLVCMPHCSNIIGQQNPVTDWVKLIKGLPQNPWVIIDGVSNAPHHIPDVNAIGCDIYLFSLYKVYSVHQGLMVVREPLNHRLANQGHFFNDTLAHYRLTPAGADHAQVAASQGVLDYILALSTHHGMLESLTLRAHIDYTNTLWHHHEAKLLAPLLAFLKQKNGIRIIGSPTLDSSNNLSRHPTISLALANHSTHDIATKLGEHGIMAGNGHFYAHRLMERLGIEPDEGVLRLSMVHYNTINDVNAAIKAIDACIA